MAKADLTMQLSTGGATTGQNGDTIALRGETPKGKHYLREVIGYEPWEVKQSNGAVLLNLTEHIKDSLSQASENGVQKGKARLLR